MRREIRHRLIAPVVHMASRTGERVELEHWQELDGGDPQLLEIRNLFDHARVGTARLFRQARVRMPGESAHVHSYTMDCDDGRRSGRSPSQSYAAGSTTTLFIAVAALSPFSCAAPRL